MAEEAEVRFLDRSAREATSELTSADDQIAYSVPQLAKKTSLSRSLIYLHVKEKRLRVIKVNSRSIVLRADAIAWLRSL